MDSVSETCQKLKNKLFNFVMCVTVILLLLLLRQGKVEYLFLWLVEQVPHTGNRNLPNIINCKKERETAKFVVENNKWTKAEGMRQGRGLHERHKSIGGSTIKPLDRFHLMGHWIQIKSSEWSSI